MARPSDYRFWLVFAALAVAVIAACSSDTSSGPDAAGSGKPAGFADAMTQG
jgi:uncharacterized lipoprotein